LAAVAALAGLLVAVPQRVVAAPPPNPSNGQISAAQARKNALADEVGQLSGQIAAMQAKLQELQGLQELAEQKYAYALSEQQLAQAAAKKAAAAFVKAKQTVTAARRDLVLSVQASYMSGSVGGAAQTLLTATDPSALLEQTAMASYAASHQLGAIGTMQRAAVAESNADAAAKVAKQKAIAATKAAQQARIEAADAVDAARAQASELQGKLASSQTALSNAQATLATLNNQRAAYNKYVAHQRYLAHLRALAEARRRAAAAAAAAAARRHHHSSGGGGGSNSSPIPASGGDWSSSRAAAAVRRARNELGVPYAWAGGNSGGPTYGVCDPSNGAPNDCNVYGFDCSGLAMYAWGPFISLPHYAAAQYFAAGSYHPSASRLRAGDLVFWSYNGTASGIHHVAIYIGGGEIIEAPYSGSYVRIANLYEYGSFYGATRPMS
jgi:cell wall-associated NlpC family hydrolase